jgi:hypothetical protein
MGEAHINSTAYVDAMVLSALAKKEFLFLDELLGPVPLNLYGLEKIR